MKAGLFIFLCSICLIGTIVNGKKFVQENETIQWHDCEPVDTDESKVTMSLFTVLLSGRTVLNSPLSSKARFAYTLFAIKKIALDSFSPPPDFLSY
ncbi:hypothetical protein ACFFSP_23910 [Persicitalea jodogahamensis]|uniref:hypothetical protein n=1 Tax=Persicitalea jodogahamensis TaxID=402147 RepID=UPI001675E8F9|nr:hypothetical protein [Persicitalea jodogahamensis]